MRFFFVACLFGLGVGLAGYITNNWSAPLVKEKVKEKLYASESPARLDRMGMHSPVLTQTAELTLRR